MFSGDFLDFWEFWVFDLIVEKVFFYFRVIFSIFGGFRVFALVVEKVFFVLFSGLVSLPKIFLLFKLRFYLFICYFFFFVADDCIWPIVNLTCLASLRGSKRGKRPKCHVTLSSKSANAVKILPKKIKNMLNMLQSNECAWRTWHFWQQDWENCCNRVGVRVGKYEDIASCQLVKLFVEWGHGMRKKK